MSLEICLEYWKRTDVFALWVACFAIGFVLFALGVYYVWTEWHEKNRWKKSWMRKPLICEFLSFLILYFPFELAQNHSESHLVFRVIHSILLSLLQTFTRFLGEGYERVAYEGKPGFSIAYSGTLAIVNILLLLFMAGYIIHFLNVSLKKIKLHMNREKLIYVFSEFNEKTLAIASSLPDNEERSIVFLCSDENLSDEDKHKINVVDGVLLDDDLVGVIQGYSKYAKELKIFLFNEIEQENLSNLGKISELLQNITIATRVYVELFDTPWDMYNKFLDGSNQTNAVVNFVRPEETYVYDNLLHQSIFENAIVSDENGDKEIKILIVGVNERNIEMLKAVLHLSQMPGYKPTIILFDEASKLGYIRTLIPELTDKCDLRGDAIYQFMYKDSMNFESEDFVNAIKEIASDFTFAYVNVGDDLKNLNVALSIRALRQRNNGRNGYKIQVSVSDETICRQWDKELMEELCITGQLGKVYSYSAITMSDIEKLSESIHIVRQNASYEKDKERAEKENKTPVDRRVLWRDYCNNEYNRHSVYARTLSFRYKVQIIKERGLDYSVTSDVDPWRIYEHMRWNMYTRTLGYVAPQGETKTRLTELTFEIENLNSRIRNLKKTKDNATDEGDNEKDNLDKQLTMLSDELKKKKNERWLIRTKGKVHEDLVPFDELHPSVKEYDSLKLTPDIVKEFESVNQSSVDKC